jgi:hypothetical protein
MFPVCTAWSSEVFRDTDCPITEIDEPSMGLFDVAREKHSIRELGLTAYRATIATPFSIVETTLDITWARTVCATGVLMAVGLIENLEWKTKNSVWMVADATFLRRCPFRLE